MADSTSGGYLILFRPAISHTPSAIRSGLATFRIGYMPHALFFETSTEAHAHSLRARLLRSPMPDASETSATGGKSDWNGKDSYVARLSPVTLVAHR